MSTDNVMRTSSELRMFGRLGRSATSADLRRIAFASIALGAIAASAGCKLPKHRAACASDGDCEVSSVCYYDGKCVPRSVAERVGAEIGDQCMAGATSTVAACAPGQSCRLGYCITPATDAGDGGAGDAGDDGLCPEGSPLFGGLTQAIADGPDAVVLRWIAAADETLAERITYLIYVAEAPGAQDLTMASHTVVGAIEHRLTQLVEGKRYYFVVHAQDEDGNLDCNNTEKSAKPEGIDGCIDYDSRVKTILDDNCEDCHFEDDSPRELFLDRYRDVIGGGETGQSVIPCKPDASLLFAKVALESPPIGDQMPQKGPYLLASQIEVLRRWIEQGALESCPSPTPDLCRDAVAPTFAGVTSATATIARSVDVCWVAGADDVTRVEGLVYDVYEVISSTSAHNFVLPAPATSAPGATCERRRRLASGKEYCWVVRARDAAGNRDDNTVKQCLVMP